MKSAILLLLLILGTSNLFADDKSELQKTREIFNRYFKSAHPLPDAKLMDKPLIFQNNSKKLPNFLNVETTDDDTGNDPNKMQNESSIAVNPKNPLNLIASAVDYRAESSTWVYVSSDGGITWRNLNLGKPYPNWRSTNDPSVMFDTEGIGYLCYGGFGDVQSTNAGLVGENGVFLAKTTDQGITWKAHIPVIIHLGNQTLDSTFEDKYYVQVDNSPKSPYFRELYIPWKRVTPRDSATQIVISKSTDFGESWSIPVNVSNRVSGSSEDTTFGQSFPLASTGPNGELYVVWNHGIEHGVGFAKSLDGGKTFTEPRIIHHYNIFGETKMLVGQGFRHVVKGTVRAEAYPSVVTDISSGPRSGNIYLSWSADNYPNVYFSKSTDKGETWTKPVIIHSDTTNDQFWHWMSIDPLTGDLGVMFLDSRNDPNNIMVECYMSYSSDGGVTWIDRRVSDINSDLRLNPFQSRAFAGDYSGNAFYDGIIYPSWVDMRNAITNLADSDVLTAIVNTRAPEPPDDFASISDLSNPKEIKLSWIPPQKRSFGQELKPQDFVHRLIRDNQVISTLDGFTNSYIDTDISAFKKYDYRIYAVAGRDSSISRDIETYAGGSEKPDIPEIISIKGNDDFNVDFEIKLPAFRSDKITPLVKLKGLYIAKDGFPPKEFSLNTTDTGKVMNFKVQADAIGFHKYRASIFDFFEELNKTTQSDYTLNYDVYAGSQLDVLVENFDFPVLPYYYVSGNWTKTDEISFTGSNSFTNADRRKYSAQQYDTLIFLPVKMPESEDLFMTFMTVCSVFPDDTAAIEVSYNDMKTWTRIATFNNLEFEEWRDNLVSNQDWKFKRLVIPNQNGAERVFVRATFKSNVLRHGDGWYLDDVIIGPKTASVENLDFAKQIKLYPNPAGDFVKIFSGYNKLSNVRIYDITGVLILNYITDNSTEVNINLSKFNSGTYFVEIENELGEIIRKLLFLTK